MSEFDLNAISPLDGRYGHKLDACRPWVSEFALIKHRLKVEVEWLIMLSQEEMISELPTFSKGQQAFLRSIVEQFTPSEAEHVREIERTTRHDVKAVEYYLKEQLKTQAGFEEALEFVHFALTSEDVNNLSYGLMLQAMRDEVMAPNIETLLEQLAALTSDAKDVPMLSRTHGQPASPSTLGKELAVFSHRLRKQAARINAVEITGKLSGAVGNFNAHLAAYPDVDWIQLSQHFVEGLGLAWNPLTTQIEPHDWNAELFYANAHFNTTLIGFSRDIWSYISLGFFKQAILPGQVGSSTMPHKVNPIDFENAEGNLGLASAIFEHLAGKLPISRWQRDLTDSTVQRNQGVAFAHSLLAYQNLVAGLKKLKISEQKIAQDLDENWAVLAEALQTVMRRYGIDQPYEKLKSLTQGTEVNQESLAVFVDSLDLPDAVKADLRALTPASYIGLAKTLQEKFG